MPSPSPMQHPTEAVPIGSLNATVYKLADVLNTAIDKPMLATAVVSPAPTSPTITLTGDQSSRISSSTNNNSEDGRRRLPRWRRRSTWHGHPSCAVASWTCGRPPDGSRRRCDICGFGGRESAFGLLFSLLAVPFLVATLSLVSRAVPSSVINAVRGRIRSRMVWLAAVQVAVAGLLLENAVRGLDLVPLAAPAAASIVAATAILCSTQVARQGHP